MLDFGVCKCRTGWTVLRFHGLLSFLAALVDSLDHCFECAGLQFLLNAQPVIVNFFRLVDKIGEILKNLNSLYNDLGTKQAEYFSMDTSDTKCGVWNHVDVLHMLLCMFATCFLHTYVFAHHPVGEEPRAKEAGCHGFVLEMHETRCGIEQLPHTSQVPLAK